jgi:hypothetical protein
MSRMIDVTITNMLDKFIEQIIDAKSELDVMTRTSSAIGYMFGVYGMEGITAARRDELCGQIKTAAKATLETMSAIRRHHSQAHS